MAAIDHLVVLMLENRSFDHMLGFLKSSDYPINGLDGSEANPGPTEPVRVNPNARFALDLAADPGHGFLDVNLQIFGNKAGNRNGPTMQGFVTSYAEYSHDAANIMNCFSPAKLSVLTTLAKAYAVCDRWFSSVPGPTIPNRAYVHAATSSGILVQTPDLFRSRLRTVYQLFDEEGVNVDGTGVDVTSRIFTDGLVLPSTIPYLLRHPEHFGTMQDFFDGCNSGRLPNYSFIEPRYGNQFGGGGAAANDQHPDHDVEEGEFLIRYIYNAIRSNDDLWKSTVLVITYDEHGGIFDHVEPEPCDPPGDGPSTDPPFDFSRLGVRVPAVIVSAYTAPKTISSLKYDHTSLLATARKLFLGQNWQRTFLTARDRNANTFDSCWDLTLAPREDVVDLEVPRAAAAIEELANRADAKHGGKEPNELVKVMVAQAVSYENSLPADRRSGMAGSLLATEHDAVSYLRAVGATAHTQVAGVRQ
jgi:phospholipase C